MIFNSHFAFKPCRNFCFQFPFSPGSAVLPRDTEGCSPVTAVPNHCRPRAPT